MVHSQNDKHVRVDNVYLNTLLVYINCQCIHKMANISDNVYLNTLLVYTNCQCIRKMASIRDNVYFNKSLVCTKWQVYSVGTIIK